MFVCDVCFIVRHSSLFPDTPSNGELHSYTNIIYMYLQKSSRFTSNLFQEILSSSPADETVCHLYVVCFYSLSSHHAYDNDTCSDCSHQYFSYIVAVTFIGGGKRSTLRKLLTCGKSLTNYHIILYRKYYIHVPSEVFQIYEQFVPGNPQLQSS
jgi:hypothetical protein